MVRVRWIALVVAVLACGAARDGAAERNAAVALGGEPDPRYRITGRLVAGSADVASRLLVRVEPRGGWHIALEAPAWLDLVGSAGVRFPQERLGRDDALVLDRETLEFGTDVSIEAEAPVTARGHLKFGICEGDESVCAIVRRDLEIELPDGGDARR